MKGRDELSRILSLPPPRPLKPIVKGPAFLRSVVYLAAAALTIAAGLVNLWTYLFAHYREPLFGNEALTASIVVFALSIGGFIVFWSMSFMNLYSVYLFRSGTLKTSRVEKAYLQEKGGKRHFVINWVVEEDGKVTKGAVSAPLADFATFRQDVDRGDAVHLLASGGDLGDAMPVGMMGLRRDWTLLPSLEVPRRVVILRWVGVLWLIACVSVATVGFMSSYPVAGVVPSVIVLISGGAGLLVAGFFSIAGRRHGVHFRPSWTVWAAAVFVATYFMVFMGIRGLNVWLDEAPGRTYKVEVLHLDDALFPTLHRAAYVRSWRPGTIKEKIPISWKMGLILSPGDTVKLRVKDGYFGVPAIIEIQP
jgi:hypothetical protein